MVTNEDIITLRAFCLRIEEEQDQEQKYIYQRHTSYIYVIYIRYIYRAPYVFKGSVTP